MKTIRARHDIRSSGDERRAFALRSGWAAQYNDGLNGERQITGFMLPGEFWNATSDYGISAITPCTIEFLDDLAADGSAFGMITDIDQPEFLLRWLLAVGSLSAEQRLAYFLHELFERLRRLGLAHEYVACVPLTQSDLAQALCLTAVHLNRKMRKLDKLGILQRDQQLIKVVQPAYLARVVKGLGLPKIAISTSLRDSGDAGALSRVE